VALLRCRAPLVVVDAVAVRDSSVGGVADVQNTLTATILSLQERRGAKSVLIVVCTADLASELQKRGLFDVTADRPQPAVAVDVLVVDEAHRLQRLGTALHRQLDSIPCSTRVCLTGYPMQNNANEFFAMLAFVDGAKHQRNAAVAAAAGRAPLPSADEFARAVAEPLSNYTALLMHIESMRVSTGAAAQTVPAAACRAFADALDRLRQLSRYRLHRAGPAVLASMLPRAEFFTVTVGLTALQRTLYQSISADTMHTSTGRVGALGKCAWLALVCAHPATMKGRIRSSSSGASSMMLDASLAESDDDAAGPGGASQLPLALASRVAECLNAHVADDDLRFGVKLRVCVDLLKAVNGAGEKCLVFAHYRTTLDLLRRFLTDVPEFRRSDGSYRFETLDGTVSASGRNRGVEAFKRPDVTAMLLTTRAGGVALNLVEATVVILLDCHWNPCHELQAIFRAFRIGQVRPVTVLRLLVAGTAELAVRDRQRGKEMVFSQALDAAAADVASLTDDRRMDAAVVADANDDGGGEDVVANSIQVPTMEHPCLSETLRRHAIRGDVLDIRNDPPALLFSSGGGDGDDAGVEREEALPTLRPVENEVSGRALPPPADAIRSHVPSTTRGRRQRLPELDRGALQTDTDAEPLDLSVVAWIAAKRHREEAVTQQREAAERQRGERVALGDELMDLLDLALHNA
jgi:hypothetical protein